VVFNEVALDTMSNQSHSGEHAQTNEQHTRVDLESVYATVAP
jgi:hypothetical protein